MATWLKKAQIRRPNAPLPTSDAASQALVVEKSLSYEVVLSTVIAALAGTTATTSGDPARSAFGTCANTLLIWRCAGFDLDSWTLAAIYLRNLFVNWLMLLPILLAAVAVPQFTYYGSQALAILPASDNGKYLVGAAVALALFLIAGFFAGFELPSRRTGNPTGPGLLQVSTWFVIPVMLANWTLVELWWSYSFGKHAPFATIYVAAVVFAISLAGLWLLCWKLFKKDVAILQASAHQDLAEGRNLFWRFLYIFLLGLVAALAATGMAVFLNAKVFPALAGDYILAIYRKPFSFLACHAPAPVDPSFCFHVDDRVYMILALPILTLAPLITISLLSALLGNIETEEDREWWSRAGAMQLAIIAGWILAHTIALYSQSTLQAIWCLISGAAVGAVGSGLGWSGQTSAGPRPVKSAQLGKVGAFLEKYGLVLPAVCAFALLLLTLAAAAGEVQLAGLLSHFVSPINQRLHVTVNPHTADGLEPHALILVAAILLTFLINQAISINIFSLNGLYRMRLMRAFLGASNTQRLPDSFTGFDPNDTPAERDLPKAPGAPLHVVNTTLNLVGTRNTAWRQRKAESFSFSPVHCGSWRLGYVPTPYYAGASGPVWPPP